MIPEAETDGLRHFETRQRFAGTVLIGIGGLTALSSVLHVFGFYPSVTFDLDFSGHLYASTATGMGVPVPPDGFEPLLLVVLAVELALAGSFMGTGWLARRGSTAAFVLALLFYSGDTLSAVRVEAWTATVCHLLALAAIVYGFLACLRLRGFQNGGPGNWQKITILAVLAIFFSQLVRSQITIPVGQVLEDQVTEMLLDRAPATLTEEDRGRFWAARRAVYDLLHEQGFLPNEEAHRMNAALLELMDQPLGGAPLVQVHETIRILEEVGQVDRESITPSTN